MKNKTFRKRKTMNTCYIAPHKHNHAKKKRDSAVPPPLKGSAVPKPGRDASSSIIMLFYH